MWAWREMPVICLYALAMRASLATCTRAVGRYTLARERCGVVWCGVVWCGVVWCAEGAVTKGQKAGMSTHG